MPKTDSTFNPDDYALVADRIALFYQHYPSGRIIPRLHAITEKAVIFEALVYRDKADSEPAAVGWAREFENDGEINKVACLENTETSAIGRALANLGFAASKKRPSYEEMAKADRERRRLAGRSATASPGDVPSATDRKDSSASDALQAKANGAMDIIRLVRTAERRGPSAERAHSLVARVAEGRLSDRSLDRLERTLRGWLSAREGARFRPAGPA
jgi:hypothetical protein